jgi:hypothetical protein
MQLPGETKVTYLQDAVLGQKHVLRLKVTVDDVMGVHEVAGFEHLPDYLLGLEVVDAAHALALNFLKDCPVKLLKDQEDAVVFPEHFE